MKFTLMYRFSTVPVAEEVSHVHGGTPDSSPELTKRSWFGSLMSTEKDETYTIIVKGKHIAQIKADLIHAFLSVYYGTKNRKKMYAIRHETL